MLIQNNPNGMGDAVLQLEKVSKSLSDNILLIWGDVPLFPKTVEMTINNHFAKDNSFTFQLFSDEPYTLVKRD